MEKLECKRCGYVWTYKGQREYYALCPNCRVQVNIKKHTVKEEPKIR